jgi:hypothetical protein
MVKNAAFNIVDGKLIFPEVEGAITQSCYYEDDTAFFFGVHRIYLKRHIVRAFEEAKLKLLPLI